MTIEFQVKPELKQTQLPETIIFFDGECGLCDRFINFCLLWDTKHKLHYAPLQGETANSILPQKHVKNIQSVICLDHGKMFTHSSAVIRVFWKLGGFWSLYGSLIYIIPPFLRDFGYRMIARNRFRLLGKKTTCRLLKPEERIRFLP